MFKNIKTNRIEIVNGNEDMFVDKLWRKEMFYVKLVQWNSVRFAEFVTCQFFT